MLKDAKVYNVVTYDGVDAYVIKVIGNDENDVYETFKNSDMEPIKIDYLYTWDDLDKHIAGVLRGEWKLTPEADLNLAIRRYIDLKCGFELACLDCGEMNV